MATAAELERVLKQRQAWQKSLSRDRSVAKIRKNALRWRWPIRSREITDFTRQLATMVSARLPLVRSLEILTWQQKNAQLRGIIHTVRQDLMRGKSLRDSLAQHPKVFPALFVNLVQAGEVSGNLPEILQPLAAYFEKIGELKRKLLTAMTYPAVIMLVAAGALSFLIFGIMPAFTDMFREFGAQIPLPTQILLNTSALIKANVLYLLLLMAAGLFVARGYSQTPTGRRLLDAIKIKLPMIGAVIKKVFIARFARTLGTLLQGGVSLLEALEITAQSSGNQIFQQHILHMKNLAARGEPMEKALAASKLFPPLVVQMIAVGEETAELGGMLAKTAEFYESEVDAAIEALTSIIEPIIIVALGIILGSTIVALYLQIFDLMNVIQ